MFWFCKFLQNACCIKIYFHLSNIGARTLYIYTFPAFPANVATLISYLPCCLLSNSILLLGPLENSPSSHVQQDRPVACNIITINNLLFIKVKVYLFYRYFVKIYLIYCLTFVLWEIKSSQISNKSNQIFHLLT